MLALSDLTDEERERLSHKRKRDRDSWGKATRALDAPVTLGELCWLERIAQERSLKAVARETGVSHVSIIKRERGAGDVDALARFWNSIGVVTPSWYWERAGA